MKTFIGLSFLLLSTIGYAEVTVYAIDIPGLHQNDGQGEYDQIIEKAVVSSGLAKLEVQPPARAEDSFASCTNCCFTPANKNPDFYDFGDDIVQTTPMNTAKIYIFTNEGQPTLNNVDDLKGKSVGIRKGMPYGNTFDAAGLNTSTVTTIEANIKKLQAGRIDAFVAYVPDVYAAFEGLGMKPLPHDADNPIAIHEDSLVCKGVSSDFVSKFNSAIQ